MSACGKKTFLTFRAQIDRPRESCRFAGRLIGVIRKDQIVDLAIAHGSSRHLVVIDCIDCKDTAQKHHQFQSLTVLNQEMTGLNQEVRMLLPVQYLPPSKAWPIMVGTWWRQLINLMTGR